MSRLRTVPRVELFLRHYFHHGRVFDAMLLVTPRCPLHCVHCYGRAAARAVLGTAAWRRVLDELAALGALMVTFSGGEPLQRRDLTVLLRHADARGFALTLFTSGTGLTARHVAAWRALRWREIAVSLYAVDPAVHDAVTGVRGSWQRSVRALERLRAAGLPVAVNHTVLQRTRGTVAALRDWTQREGYHLHQSAMLIPAFDGDCAPLRERLPAVLMRPRPAVRRPPPPRWRRGCGCGEGLLLVDAYGDVWPCTYFPLPLGSVRHAALRELWTSSPLLPVIRRGLDRAALRSRCNRCALRRDCRRCYGQAYAEEGSVYRVLRAACRARGLTPPAASC